MAIKPILFNGEMVRAILSREKSCTRRLVKFPEGQTGRLPECGATDYLFYPGGIKRPPYQVGDILYVRETWYKYGDLDDGGRLIEGTEKYYYRADGENPTPYNYFLSERDEYKDYPEWKPSIHMPREAARIWLKVKKVRAERLQEITNEEAKAEGANFKNGKNVGFEEKMRRTAIERFTEIWDGTVKKSDICKYGWNANPWVWVIEFELCAQPDPLEVKGNAGGQNNGIFA